MKKVGELLNTQVPKYDGTVYPERSVHYNDRVGVEIEFEHNHLYDQALHERVRNFWNWTDDGSLRDGGSEIVFRGPLSGEDVSLALGVAEKALNKCRFSHRTSVHVHVDIRDITAPSLYRYILLYITLEEALFGICGRQREANNFCMSAYSANGLVELLSGINPSRVIASILGRDTAHFRYAAVNIDAVRKFGSLEFRGHEGTCDKARILLWINLLLAMKHYAVRTRDIEEVITKASSDGPLQVIHECFTPDIGERLLEQPGIERMLADGARRAQDVVHRRDTVEAHNQIIAQLTGRAKRPVEHMEVDWDDVRALGEVVDEPAAVEARGGRVRVGIPPVAGQHVRGADYQAFLRAQELVRRERGEF